MALTFDWKEQVNSEVKHSMANR